MTTRLSGRRLAELLGPADVSVPRYRSLADGIRSLVWDARVLDGTRLPSERELVVALGVSRTTVTKAYGELIDAGYAVARRGSGTVVSVPGGPAAGGGEPIGPAGDPGAVPHDLICASPAPVPGVAAAVRTAAEQLPRFACDAGYFAEGLPELRQAIADRYAERGVPTTPDQILVTGGAQAAAALLMQGAVARGRVLLETPGYPNSVAAVRNAGHRVVSVPATERPDFEEIERLAASGAVSAMLVVADFQNPTGRLLNDADRERLTRIWRRHDVLGIVDETLCETWLDERPEVSPVAAFDGDVVTIGSASKTYWGGLRMGWIRTTPRRVAALSTARRALDLAPPVIDQLTLVELLCSQPTVPPEARAQYTASRDLLLEFGRSLGWSATTPGGGLAVWWTLPAARSTALVAAGRRRGVALHSGSAFAVDGRGLDRYVRTPFALAPDRLATALPPLREAAIEVGIG
ncbi:PLP-dependent aminotransferase family protein [Calidifontibacter sp. DB0510]|uniref:PLP-dependent aminotransferase family protein n=1 Tax=Metallococcus carri TaxID=1656884 RepID=A0A967B3M0_9MICO|nr:PLP-dependent aminotransferase family protein [Metallococcus carri]NHN56923.1 PLP-dependent aminotransferase family protein [Metallococcus carri]NOP37668.1 PLP-dependent aminotransferase family protein [Calidifontibacter sp. DB2511S]